MTGARFPFHGLNYPSDVRECDPGAPWNAVAEIECDACGRVWYPDGEPRTRGNETRTGEPVTAFGIENAVCAECETVARRCMNPDCGEWFEPDDIETAAHCPDCVEWFSVNAQCAECGAFHSPRRVGTVCNCCKRGIIRAHSATARDCKP